MKKIVTFLCALVMSIMIFTGCNVFARDDYKYYNKVVASIGDHKFLMKDLLQYYSINGYTYVEQQNYTLEEAIKQTVDDMINRHLLVEELVGTGLVDIEPYKADIMREVYAEIDKQIYEYEDEVRIDWDMDAYVPAEDAEGEDNTESGETLSKYERTARNEYTSKYEAQEVSGAWTIVRVETKIECDTTPAPTKWTQKITDAKVSAEAKKRYLADLKASAKSMGEKKLDDETLLQNEIDRIYKIFYENKVISVYQTMWENALPVDSNLVVEKYKSLWETDYHKYKQLNASDTQKADAKRKTNYNDGVASDSSALYYHVDNSFVEVAHILLQVDEYTQTLTKQLDEQSANYESQLQALVNDNLTTIYYLDEDGKECQGSRQAVIDMIVNYVESGNDVNYSRTDRFLEMMYRFNEDPGIMNTSKGYAIPMDNTEVADTMVKSFADGSRELALSQPEGGNIKVVYSIYGIHIIYNLGMLSSNGLTLSTINNVTAQKLWETRVSPISEQTLFEKVADTLTEESINTKLQSLIEQAKIKLQNEGIKINLYTSRYESLWK